MKKLLIFFIEQKITKSCKWVGVWFCVFYLKEKKKKKNSIVVFGWQNIISQWHYPQHIHVPGVPHH
jgi:hypothetical protein